MCVCAGEICSEGQGDENVTMCEGERLRQRERERFLLQTTHHHNQLESLRGSVSEVRRVRALMYQKAVLRRLFTERC